MAIIVPDASFPAINPWLSLSLIDAVPSLDYQTLTFGAAGYLESFWIDCLNPAGLALARWTGTATLASISTRSSAEPPTTTDATALIVPNTSEAQRAYSAASGTLPPDQGWATWSTAPDTATVSDGALRVTSDNGSGGWGLANWPGAPANPPYAYIEFGVSRNAAHQLQAVAYFDTPYSTNRRLMVTLNGTAGSSAGLCSVGGVNLPVVVPVGTKLNVRIGLRKSPAGDYPDPLATVHWRLGDTGAWTTAVTVLTTTTATAAGVYWGVYGTASYPADANWHYLRVWAGAEWSSVANGAAPGGRRYHQIRGNPISGTLTTLDLACDLTAPPAIAVAPLAGALDTSTVAGNAVRPTDSHTGAVVPAFQWNLYDASTSALVATKSGPADGAVFTEEDCAFPASCKLGVRAVSLGGIRSTTETLSDAFAVPPVAPSVSLTTGNHTPGPGEDVTLSAVLTGTTATLDGAAWDGTATTIATAEAASGYVPPSTPPAPVPYREPGPLPAPEWSE